MQVFMSNINYTISENEVTSELAKIFHGRDYQRFSSTKLNFNVYLFRDKARRGKHSGRGALTLPTAELGNYFLKEFSDEAAPTKAVILGGRRIKFSLSNRVLDPRIVESIIRQPYVDPNLQEQKQRREQEAGKGRVSIKAIQFGWECRDSIFSIECEHFCENLCSLSFDEDRRELRVSFQYSLLQYIIAVRFSQILSISAHMHVAGQEPIIFISLSIPPTYEQEFHPTRRRLSALPIPDHSRVAPYTSLAIRLVCSSQAEIYKFHTLAHQAKLHSIANYDYHTDRRGLFSAEVVAAFEDALRKLNWSVAFQVMAIVRNLYMDIQEMLGLIPRIRQIVDSKGVTYAAMLLRHFGGRIHYEDEDVAECFKKSEGEYEKLQSSLIPKPTEGSLFDSLHISITPTTMYLEGPFPERSNRVLRSFRPTNHESFLRVSFVDEGSLQYRFDRDVNGPLFIRERIGPFLKDSLQLAKRIFRFLAYSQSALKEHTVWFVKPFWDQGHYVDAEKIIRSLGTFHNLEFDSQLLYCPARYAARISQAFTATDLSVSVEVEEIVRIPDVSTNPDKYHFTDGVGTISKELAREIWTVLKKTNRRVRRSQGFPRALQVRFMGSKGMLSVDYKLEGRAICIRPSMIKFEAPNSREIEIARAFDRPGPYFLNRPLIMLLEGLGVPYEVFKAYQDKAVRETEMATTSLARAGRLLENYGLGTSYRLTSVMLNLERLGIDSLPGDASYDKMIEYSINHVLRVLKNHARIPIPNAWTLVGVADIHKYLAEGEIFACIKPIDGKKIYLEGLVLISRSPTIHPGDVQIARAIGPPPEGSCFEVEQLPNTVVFSILGKRPLPSMLGGGDLDGDLYNLIPLRNLPFFRPRKICLPADYNPAKKKFLNRPSTMEDVADFVMEYISSDVLGIIAINWLIIADQSEKGIFDEDCLTLSNLHSDAVDFPKSGQPVSPGSIPRLKMRKKPDWNAPETANPDSDKYYTSQRAIGKLFRAIKLPAELPSNARTRRVRRRHRDDVDSLSESLSQFSIDDTPLFTVVEDQVRQFIRTDTEPDGELHATIEEIFNRYQSELRNICAANSLSYERGASLTEEEAMIGTIIQRTSQPRKRSDMMSKLREQTDILVRSIREELAADDDLPYVLERGWVAWRLSLEKREHNVFGGLSFSWLALGAIFEAVRTLNESMLEESRSRFY